MIGDRSVSVSLCMIVRNEGHQLSDCLDSVAGLFDEIVIVDTGSTDQTREVAREYTSQIFEFPWRDDFSAARNESLRHAHGDWVFWLDADDRLSSENADRLRKLLRGLNRAPAVYLMDTICRTSGTGEVERRLSHPRLFLRHPAIAWRRRVHEQLHPWPAALGYEVKFSEVQVDHVGYRDTAVIERKRRRNLRLLQMDYAIDPDDPETLMELGVVHTRRGSTRQARTCFDRLLETAPRYFVDQQRVFAWRAELAMQEGEFREMAAITRDGLTRIPGDEYLTYLQAEALYHLADYQAAGKVLGDLISDSERSHGFCYGEPNDIRLRLAPLAFGEVLRMQRSYNAAEKVLHSVVEKYLDDAAAWQFLGRVFVDTGEQHKLKDVYARLSTCDSGHLYAGLLRVAWEMVRGDIESAERIIDELICQAPEMPLGRLIRADCLERRGAPIADRLKAYRDVLRVQPGNARAVGMLRRLQDASPRPTYDPCGEIATSVFYVGVT
jgi:glycosyltransferase involved in cell wall biosynthesis